ncbi:MULTISPECIES: transglutaminase-like domain-containing protein [unclassified Lysobacter]|uniref:transglutaminase-like domain-containing protein n=1 Tax=unclassified Lysobacter TaxID=2635362 RepID=UPI001BEA00FC|nr:MULTISPECIES: transglutaminase-like domain-containing protein [unclassified Lysobacter]MBT2747655.1 transglutaminase domain-containing protein [Lysobacter sp. ISL-42]MBT2752864.1 transglutaminase domain-containing protein [Lysobacter sp. ISL-50]MBT2779748.1 transglutaminase domain-containing protein [Lysobacter sp. ISL-54]MBT2784560.1 transglutaminase domain-containing protein [Lysobacter sp. ISL-52]
MKSKQFLLWTLLVLSSGWIGVAGAADSVASEAELKAQIQALLVPSPYRMSPAARHGTIRYRLSERDAAVGWPWPQTGEQYAMRSSDGLEVTVCRDCGRETAPDAEALRRYLAPTPWLQSGDRAVTRFARAAGRGSTDARMRHLVAAVQAHLSGPVVYRDYLSAREALAGNEGDCTEYALLLAAAARARGIPARVVAGLAYGSRFVGRAHSFGPHMWVQVWNGERWVSYDAGMGEFDAGHLALVVGDGNPESVRGAMQAIAGLRIEDAVGVLGEDRAAN